MTDPSITETISTFSSFIPYCYTRFAIKFSWPPLLSKSVIVMSNRTSIYKKAASSISDSYLSLIYVASAVTSSSLSLKRPVWNNSSSECCFWLTAIAIAISTIIMTIIMQTHPPGPIFAERVFSSFYSLEISYSIWSYFSLTIALP